MPNLGMGELLVILLVALLVFGPKRLPEMMKSLGKALRAFQDESTKAMDQLRVAAEPSAPATDHGVIDRPDEAVLAAAEAERGTPNKKRSSTTTAAKKAAPRKTAAKKAAPRKTAKPRATSAAPKSAEARRALEDT